MWWRSLRGGGGGQRGARRTCGVAGPTDAGTSAPLFSGVAHTAPIVASRQPSASGTFARDSSILSRIVFSKRVGIVFLKHESKIGTVRTTCGVWHMGIQENVRVFGSCTRCTLCVASPTARRVGQYLRFLRMNSETKIGNPPPCGKMYRYSTNLKVIITFLSMKLRTVY